MSDGSKGGYPSREREDAPWLWLLSEQWVECSESVGCSEGNQKRKKERRDTGRQLELYIGTREGGVSLFDFGSCLYFVFKMRKTWMCLWDRVEGWSHLGGSRRGRGE